MESTECQDPGIELLGAQAYLPSYRSADDTQSRDEAVARAFWLVREAQSGAGDRLGAIDQLIDDGEQRGWPDVVLGGMYAACVLAAANGDERLPEAIEQLRVRAEAEADHAVVAMALALRARSAARSRDAIQTVAADADLARATVLLESAEGGALPRASAHNACALVYGLRQLWELQDQQYVAADKLLTECQDSPLLPT